MSATSTSWEKVGGWYQDIVGPAGHYYHQHVVLPGVLRLLDVKAGDRVLDLGCGQGVLARALPKRVGYLGVDIAKNLIESAKKLDHEPGHDYLVANAAGKLELKTDFTQAACILALQNVDQPQRLLANAARALTEGGSLVIVINHPCFRIPRQSSWEVDATNKLQYRRINRYLSPLKVPIAAHPGQKQSAVTWSFHWPLRDLFAWLREAGLAVEALEEWESDKSSEGKAAKMENRARAEFPLFLALKAKKTVVGSDPDRI
jgi:ubiquinone/menaquinone biosynthesis C-methylase UbiE